MIQPLPFEDQAFDKIMTIHTLYFWMEAREPAQTFKELSRVLKPGGRIAITLSTGKLTSNGVLQV